MDIDRLKAQVQDPDAYGRALLDVFRYASPMDDPLVGELFEAAPQFADVVVLPWPPGPRVRVELQDRHDHGVLAPSPAGPPLSAEIRPSLEFVVSRGKQSRACRFVVGWTGRACVIWEEEP